MLSVGESDGKSVGSKEDFVGPLVESLGALEGDVLGERVPLVGERLVSVGEGEG